MTYQVAHQESPTISPQGSQAIAPSETWGQALDAWWAEKEWSHVVTLTFAEPRTLQGAVREFHDVWLRRVARHAKRPLAWVRVVAGGYGDYRTQVRVLVAGTACLNPERLRKAWKAGDATVLSYDPARGAAFYMSDHMADLLADWDLSARPWRDS